MFKSSLQDQELEISARMKMQISGAAGGEWHSSMFDGILSSLVAAWQTHDSTERWARGKHTQPNGNWEGHYHGMFRLNQWSIHLNILKRMKGPWKNKSFHFHQFPDLCGSLSVVLWAKAFSSLSHLIKHNGVKYACLQCSELFLIHQMTLFAPLRMTTQKIGCFLILLE